MKQAEHCWPFLPCKAEEANRAARCDKWGQRGHRSSSDTAHRIPGHPSLDLDALSQKFARRVTREESDRLNASRNQPAKGRAKGTTRGRGRGGGRIGPRAGYSGSSSEPLAEPPPELPWDDFSGAFLLTDEQDLEPQGEGEEDPDDDLSGNESPSE